MGASGAINPLHMGPGVGYSDAFLSLAVPLLALLAISFTLLALLAISFTLRGTGGNRAGSPEKGCAAGDRGNI
jgi:hypothetical protein